MDLALLVYGISLLHGLKIVFAFLASSAFFAGTLAVIIGGAENNFKITKTTLKFAIPALIIGGLGSLFTPTEKTAYMMVAAYTAQRVSESPTVVQLNKKVIKLVEAKLDSYIEEMAQPEPNSPTK